MKNSTYILDNHRQIDGRIYVTERHIDDSDELHEIIYLAPANWTDTEFTATMLERATQIDADLAEAELTEAINGV